MPASARRGPPTPSELITKVIESTDDWRGATMAAVRKAIVEADPKIEEEWKWMGTPTFSRDGVICVITLLKNRVKVTFSRGAEVPDPEHVFNAGLDGKMWRAIDFHEGDPVRVAPLKRLVRAAAARNHEVKQAK